jgi:hypothetical protein
MHGCFIPFILPWEWGEEWNNRIIFSNAPALAIWTLTQTHEVRDFLILVGLNFSIVFLFFYFCTVHHARRDFFD